MSEEEKEAIEILEIISEFGHNDYEFEKQKNATKIVLNLIDKQQKEIEENNKYSIKFTDEQYNKVINAVHNEWKDKIKAKIDEVENKLCNIRNANFTYAGEMMCEAQIKILQELLKEGE